MTYTRDGDTIRFEMKQADYARLLYFLGIATAAAAAYDRSTFRDVVQFVNELNANNPDYKPYELPPADMTVQ